MMTMVTMMLTVAILLQRSNKASDVSKAVSKRIAVEWNYKSCTTHYFTSTLCIEIVI